jgi:hypothetical protein
MNPDVKLEKLKSIIDLLDTDRASTDEVAQAFEAVFEIIRTIKVQLDQEIKTNKGEMDDLFSGTVAEINKLEHRMTKISDRLEEKMGVDNESIRKQLLKEVKTLKDLIPQLPDLTYLEERIGEVEKKIPQIPDEITPYQVRNKLESIDNESEKLDIDAIKNLRKELEDLKKKWTSRPIFGGGGFNYGSVEIHIIDDETPTGTKNGVNTNFTLAHLPSPTSSLKIYVNGQRQRVTTNYTFSGTTISFIDAPLSTDVILCDYRI